MKTRALIEVLILTVLFMVKSMLSFTQSESGYLPSDPIYIETLPVITTSPEFDPLSLPMEVDNSETIYFPRQDNTGIKYIYNQSGTSSCQSVATIFNDFAYEINRLSNVPTNSQDKRYAPNFCWNQA
jgi:hypothetical protein